MDKNNLLSLCVDEMKSRGIYDEKHRERLKMEWREIVAQNEENYFIDLCDKKLRFPKNENNLLIAYLLGLVDDFNIDQPPGYDYGDYPDVDSDYVEGVREYLKEDFAKKMFGDEYVCNIANYNTFGMRLALTDMARIFGQDHEEVKAITKHLKDKDEEGKRLTWDQAIELFDDLREYCEAHPDVADAARRMVGRIRGRGQHASGLIVSCVPIRKYIPLIQGKENSPASAWVEGLGSTDLSTVGFIKFDFLGLDGNQKIADTCRMACQSKFPNDIIKDSVGEDTVCALPGQPSWSDTSYLNDEKALKMAAAGDLRMVFQFDGSPGIRKLAKDGGVDSFDDLVAYSALYRPSCLQLGMHERYIARKRGKEPWEVHPALADGPANLSFTYGVLIYQEQIARILNTVGKIPLKDCETVRKAISKKKIDKFAKYKGMFVENGQDLGFSAVELEDLWKQIEAFAGYGFGLGHSVGYTYISSRMLWLKAHLTNHFVASMFTHTKASSPMDYNKLKEYKREAGKYGVKMAGLDINKSKCQFLVNPEDGVIYYGFEKIKGIGEEAARRIVDGQPYDGLMDFLKRFGTEAKVVQACIALGCFRERDPETLYLFYEYYKKFEKAESGRIKRFENTKAKLMAKIEADPDPKTLKKLDILVANKEKKDQFLEPPNLKTFNPDKCKIKKNDKFIEMLRDKTGNRAEVEYYGYVWHHPIERCPDYQGQVFEDFIESANKDGEVEAVVNKVTKKKNRVTYYSIQLEDATGAKRNMTVWEDDFLRFENELKDGNMVRLWVDAPKPPYPTFTLHTFPGRWKRPPVNSDRRVLRIGP